jgi:lysophospholipase L1-like esterase
MIAINLISWNLYVCLLVGTVSTQQMVEPHMRIVTLGDSITLGVRPGVKPEETFSALLDIELHKNGIECEVTDVGIGGERTDQALKRLEKDVISLKPQLVTVMYGTNDSYVDQGKDKSRLSISEYRENLRKLVARLRDANIQPILMTEPRWGDKIELNGVGESPNVRLESYVQVCREVAHETKTPMVDNFKHWSKKRTSGVDIDSWTIDQCHPNREGHHEILKTMLPVVLKAIRKKREKR